MLEFNKNSWTSVLHKFWTELLKHAPDRRTLQKWLMLKVSHSSQRNTVMAFGREFRFDMMRPAFAYALEGGSKNDVTCILRVLLRS